ncbi:hypothetical protein [Polyangium aurulentum]|uniref:hypothetical protein n=1 Tax=Polyangium aurulentum TaxID=2567896 RepID=UPI0010ADFCC9|nr:hypothetical protein [Polyangium aurulentum]UQA56304.1 hypothetical protein E8A73_034050 [Polyangium aurulentum]
MKYTDAVQTNTSTYAWTLSNQLFDMMRGLTVMLKDTDNTFTGTGVIYKVEKSRAWILTATHNLHVYASDNSYTKSHGDLKDKFLERGQVVLYGNRRAPVQGTYGIDEIVFDDEDTSCGYDVCSIRVNSLPLANTVSKQLEQAWGVPKGFDKDKLSLYPNVQELMGKKTQLDKLALFQFGYGKFTGRDKATYHSLRWRSLRWSDLNAATPKPVYMDKTKDKYENVLTFASSDATSTTSPGDSGGPTFLIENAGAKVSLLGLTLGANFFVDKVDKPNDAIVNNAITILSEGKVKKLVP